MSQQEFVVSGCSSKRYAFPQPGAASRGHSSMYTATFWEGSVNHARLCKSKLVSVLPPDVVFLCCCPVWSANACCLLRAPAVSFRGSPRGCGSSVEPRSSSALTCRLNTRALVGGRRVTTSSCGSGNLSPVSLGKSREDLGGQHLFV